MWTLLVQEVVRWVYNVVISRSGIIAIPALISKVLGYESVRLVGESIDESDGDNVDGALVAIVLQAYLRRALTLVSY